MYTSESRSGQWNRNDEREVGLSSSICYFPLGEYKRGLLLKGVLFHFKCDFQLVDKFHPLLNREL